MIMNSTRIATRSPRQRGFSMVEVMIALIVGLVLMAGVGQIFLGSNETRRIQDARARLQENARFAIDILARDFRQAAYLGCSNAAPLTYVLNNPNPVGTPPAYPFRFRYEGIGAGAGWPNFPDDTANPSRYTTIAAIQGFEWIAGHAGSIAAGNWSPARDASIPTTNPNLRPGSDILTVRGPLDEGLRLTANMASNTANLSVGANAVLSKCDLIVVSDCASATIVQITNDDPETGTIQHAAIAPCSAGTKGNPGNAVDTLASAYQAGADVLKYGTTSYFVRSNNDDDQSPEPALYRRRNLEASEELVEGVESMQILYGVDNDPMPAATAAPNTPDYTPNFYLTAADIAANNLDWRRVVSVRISLLMRTREDNLSLTAQTFPFNGAEFPSEDNPDRRLRQVFTTTISIRNRLP